MSRPFAHLHCHTHYSLLDGANRIPEVVKKVKGAGMNSLAITDHGNLYGAMEFYNTCRAQEINPILGFEAYIAPGKMTDRSGASRMKEASFHLTLLAMNRKGFENLMHMSSIAYLEGFYYKPRIDKELLEEFNEGIICLSGCAAGELSQLLLSDKMTEARELTAWYERVFGDRFYMEIQNAGFDIQRECAEGTIDLANTMGLPLVATNDAHYLNQSDAHAHDILLCVNTRTNIHDEKRMIPPRTMSQRDHLALRRRGQRETFRATRLRTGSHQEDGLRQLLFDRLGLCPVRWRTGHPVSGSWISMWSDCRLCARFQPRLSA